MMKQPIYDVGDLLSSDVDKNALCIVTSVYPSRVSYALPGELEYTGLYLREDRPDGEAKFSGRTYSLRCKHFLQLCQEVGCMLELNISDPISVDLLVQSLRVAGMIRDSS